MTFPITQSDWETLIQAGNTVVYTTTPANTAPDATWVLWGENVTGNTTNYVWRKIVPISDANQYGHGLTV